MDAMLPSRLGKLRIICSLPLFSDAICLKKQSAAEHGFTQVLLSIALAPHLGLSKDAECELIELAIFAELPKALLGDPSFYLRQRHPEASAMYKDVRGRLYKETEESFRMKTSRSPELYGLHRLVDAFAAMLFIEKECLLGNSYFQAERYRTHYHQMRRKVLAGENLSSVHPVVKAELGEGKEVVPAQRTGSDIDWCKAIDFLDALFDDATRARLEGGIGEYSATFVGMMEKLKEHYRYKGWSYLFPESVGEHTYQVVFLARILASALGLRPQERIELYRLAAMHDLAEAYASDVVYPVKVREKDLGKMHAELEEKVIEDICSRLGMTLSNEAFLGTIVEICDRFSAQLYFDRERRGGNTHFDVPNTSMDRTREKYKTRHPEVFLVLDELWDEFQGCFAPPGKR
ncbi:MAG: HD domain-containing protein [Betaproteobacteria bacterium]|nr:HD domain-containing protein [Betaproteobacteria bacterium]